ncbi:hypothetical protein RQM47_10525 [Rubrivirga sp. S365]|uniref:hypothetical protein n=1 Tax=Rubrivirga sp. S365 TaxID=3076080 RepID=UPI0028C8E082|nr:hypothetical protein [Rubrivirga sp. S365]MDT7857076.1 hypothetical protein [Rubrivirga sp. S365]
MSRDDREGIALSLGVHAVLLVFLVLVAATPSETLDEDYPPQLTEIEFGVAPTLPVVEGPPQSAPSAAPSEAAEQPEPERPAPPAATPARVPRRTPTPPRDNPLPRPAPTPEARPAPPNPPSSATRPEPRPTAPTNTRPTRGGGRSEGDASTAGTDDGAQRGSGGDAATEVGFNRGNRADTCPTPPFDGIVGEVRYRVTYSPSGSYVANQPLPPRNSDLDRLVQGVINRCRAEPLPAGVPQVNQSNTVTFRFRAN